MKGLNLKLALVASLMSVGLPAADALDANSHGADHSMGLKPTAMDYRPEDRSEKNFGTWVSSQRAHRALPGTTVDLARTRSTRASRLATAIHTLGKVPPPELSLSWPGEAVGPPQSPPPGVAGVTFSLIISVPDYVFRFRPKGIPPSSRPPTVKAEVL